MEMQHWNYRIIKKGGVFGVYEVYYDNEGKVVCYTERPVSPGGDTLEEMKQDFKRYKKAFKEEVIDMDKEEKEI